MTSLLLSFILWAQGIPVQPTQGGTITGVLRDSAGRPAAGIRVSAVARPDSIEEVIGGASAMSSIAETDVQGRYALENVPPGRYFVAAGILNVPTYYPGTQAMAEGKIVTVTAGGTVAGIDFAIKDSSGGRIIGTGGGIAIGGFAIPLDIRVETGAKMPIFGGGKVTGVRAVPVGGGSAITATVMDPSLPLQPTTAEYRVTMEGLPDAYAVKSMTYGNTVITDGILRLGAAPAVPVVPAVPAGISTAAGFLAYLNAIGHGGALQAPIPQTLSVLLMRTAVPAIPGVRVTGEFTPTIRGAFLSGASAAIYLDHSYEFVGVQPGRHALTAFGSNANTAFAASIIIGDQDINGIELEETSALPLNTRTPTPPGPAGNRAPGRVPLAAVRGKIVDAETGEPLTQGDVFLVGDYWLGHPLNSDGTFEFGKLLPGKYEIEVKAVGYPTFRREFAIDEQDMELQVKSD